jgi:hypothetical protein
VFTASRISRAIVCALACTLLASAMSGQAAARSSDVSQSASAAQERYYSSYGEPQPIDTGKAAARAQERYYSSYGELEAPSPSDDTPWLPIALSIAVTLVMVTAGVNLRRLRIRRRRAARVTT